MSRNINDTNVSLLKIEVENLKNDMDKIIHDGESIDDWESSLKKKYSTLSSTSNTLFMYIIKNYNTNRFNEEFFNKTLNMMFNKIEEIQKFKTEQNDASIEIGEHLAKTFIPQLSKNK